MIEINELDRDGLERLVKARVGDRLSESIDWDLVMDAAVGYKPAFVTEFADRAIRYAMVRNNGSSEGVELLGEDLIASAQGLRPQFEMMTGAKDRHERPKLDEALGRVIKGVVRDTFDERVLVESENGDN